MKKMICFAILIFFFLSFEGMAMEPRPGLDSTAEPPPKRRKIASPKEIPPIYDIVDIKDDIEVLPPTPPIYDIVDIKDDIEVLPPTPPIDDNVDIKNEIEVLPPIPPIYKDLELVKENTSKETIPSKQKKPPLIREKTRMGESLTKMPRTLKRENAVLGNALEKEL